ncbi:uncharacterized protein LOC143028761 [Oratosquilla oratoria]|uniref:uncharacterized protein LOC143028761 n=1 Tax=Oratosquilla oratoria TaxID=337810 RepID=UPI003F760332
MKAFLLAVLLGIARADKLPAPTYGTPSVGGFNGGLSGGFNDGSNGGFNGGFSGGFNGGFNGGANGGHSGGYGYGPSQAELELLELSENIPGGGVPGQDYPVLSDIPETGFACETTGYPHGYYADTTGEASCQVFHICQTRPNGYQKDSFLCPNGTIFNQQYLVCDWWFNVDCSQATNFYSVNELIGQEPNAYGVSNALSAVYGVPGQGSGSGFNGGSRTNGNGGRRNGSNRRNGSGRLGSGSGFGANGFSGNGFANGASALSSSYRAPGQTNGNGLSGNGFGNNGFGANGFNANGLSNGASSPSSAYTAPGQSNGNGRSSSGLSGNGFGINGFNGNRFGNNGFNGNGFSSSSSAPSSAYEVPSQSIGNGFSSGFNGGRGQNGNGVVSPSTSYGAPF